PSPVEEKFRVVDGKRRQYRHVVYSTRVRHHQNIVWDEKRLLPSTRLVSLAHIRYRHDSRVTYIDRSTYHMLFAMLWITYNKIRHRNPPEYMRVQRLHTALLSRSGLKRRSLYRHWHNTENPNPGRACYRSHNF